MIKKTKTFFRDLSSKIFSIITLKSIFVSGKRKIKLVLKILILVLLISLKSYFPQAWISYGLFPAIFEIVLFYISLDLIFHILRNLIVSIYRRKHKIDINEQDNFILGIDKSTFFFIHFIFVISLLYFFGVNIQAFLTTLGIFAVGLAIIFKEILANILAGFIIMFSNEIKLKEYVQINEYKGRIVDLNFLNVELKSDDGNIVYVPNFKFFTEDLINYSKSSLKRVAYDFNLDFVFFGEIDKLEKNIAKALYEEFENLVNEENISLKVKQIASNRVSIALEVIVSRFNFKVENNILQFSSRFILKFVHKEKKRLEKQEQLKEIELMKELN
jgi:small-conductance mechanosensitive channel